jgi:protein-tyrosine phosphatase
MNASGNPPLPAATRTYALAGGHNFRDMGGYRTADGRTVAWGRIFRSGTLAHLTDEDHALMAPLGVRLVFDLRTNRERSAYPTRWIEGHETELWSRDHEISRADLASVVANSEPGSAAAHEMTLSLYRRLPFEQSESYSELMKRIAIGQVPLVFHCSAGKDRTGVFGAVLLDLLGVDRRTIVSDYVLSDEHYDALRAMFVRDRKIHDMGAIDLDRLAPLLYARPEYLETAFEEISERHGSTAGYAMDVLGLNEAEIEAIRGQLLV